MDLLIDNHVKLIHVPENEKYTACNMIIPDSFKRRDYDMTQINEEYICEDCESTLICEFDP